VLLVPATANVFQSPVGAHGLLVPGEGATVSRRGALASLLSGEMGNAILRNGVPHGAPIISLSRQAARTTFYVALPPPGKHHNVRRYPIAVVGPGYSGVLTSSSTRLPGLVSIADVAPSVKALRRGEKPRIRSKPDEVAVEFPTTISEEGLQRFDERDRTSAVAAQAEVDGRARYEEDSFGQSVIFAARRVGQDPAAFQAYADGLG